MGNLNAFLKPAYTERTISIVLGDRFLNEDGSPEPVIMRSLTQEQIQQIARDATKEKKVNGKTVTELDPVENMNRCLVESLVFPDLKNAELCRSKGTLDPYELPSKLFLLDEYSMLTKAFAKLNGIKIGDDGEMEIPGEVTKN